MKLIGAACLFLNRIYETFGSGCVSSIFRKFEAIYFLLKWRMRSFILWLLINRRWLRNCELFSVGRVVNILIFQQLSIVGEVSLRWISSLTAYSLFLNMNWGSFIMIFLSVFILFQTVEYLLNFWVYLINIVDSVSGVSVFYSGYTFLLIIVDVGWGSGPFICVFSHKWLLHIFDSF